MDRLDLAKKELAAIKSWADDATLAQLVEAWVNVIHVKKKWKKESNFFYRYQSYIESRECWPNRKKVLFSVCEGVLGTAKHLFDVSI